MNDGGGADLSSMYTLLPKVLLNLSKIFATVNIARPVLEFLSSLISHPKVFTSFNSFSMFAITLPYTNPTSSISTTTPSPWPTMSSTCGS